MIKKYNKEQNIQMFSKLKDLLLKLSEQLRKERKVIKIGIYNTNCENQKENFSNFNNFSFKIIFIIYSIKNFYK